LCQRAQPTPRTHHESEAEVTPEKAMSESKPVTAPGVDRLVALERLERRAARHATLHDYAAMQTVRDDARAIRERLQSQPSGWRPISQHDEGGTNVLLWDTEDRRAYIGYRSEGDEFLHETEEWPIRASHFQLLPPPPQEQP